MPPRPIPLFVLVAALLALPLWSTSAAAADLKGALAYVPNDAPGAMTIDVDAIRPTPLAQKALAAFFKAEPRSKQRLDELKKNTGFDPIAHTHAVVLTVGRNFPKADGDFLLIGEAKLDEKRLIAFMKKEGTKLTPKNDALGKYYLLGEKADGAIAFRDKFVIIGGIDVFRQALAKKGPSAKLSAALAPHLGKHVGFALELTPTMKAELQKEQPDLGTMQLLTGSAHLKDGLEIHTVATFATAAAPTKLAKQANEGLAQIKQDKQLKQLGLDGMVNRIKVSAVKNELRLDVTLSAADIDRLEKLAGQFL